MSSDMKETCQVKIQASPATMLQPASLFSCEIYILGWNVCFCFGLLCHDSPSWLRPLPISTPRVARYETNWHINTARCSHGSKQTNWIPDPKKPSQGNLHDHRHAETRAQRLKVGDRTEARQISRRMPCALSVLNLATRVSFKSGEEGGGGEEKTSSDVVNLDCSTHFKHSVSLFHRAPLTNLLKDTFREYYGPLASQWTQKATWVFDEKSLPRQYCFYCFYCTISLCNLTQEFPSG